ncbi:MAG: phage protease [Methylococcaceae bacterium]
MKKELITLAACSTDLGGTVPTEIQLTPAGIFKAKDGRPVGLNGWILNNENAQAVVQLANSQADAFVIDYEHQTLYAKQNGQPAPAAGWFSDLQYREGLGLFATKIEWTETAALAIQAKEYRYISPVLQFNPKTGEVIKVLMAALTNNPALDSMKDLCALATDYFSTQQDSKMEEIDKLKARIAELETQLAEAKKTAACAVEVPTVDLSQHVPVAAVLELQQEIAALNSRINQNAVDDLVKVGLSDGRITPALSDWAKSLSHEALSAFLDKATPIAALSGTQTGGTPPAGEPEPELTPEEIAVCSAMGIAHDQFIATKGAK